VSGTVTFSGCTLSGQAVAVDCGYTLTGTTQPVTGLTSGNADVTCGVFLAGTKLCHIGGAVPGHYANPVGATAGKLTVTTSSTLTTSNGPVGSCPLGNGDKAHLTQLIFNVSGGSGGTGTQGPIITRTA